LFIANCIEKHCTWPLSAKKEKFKHKRKFFASLEFGFIRVQLKFSIKIWPWWSKKRCKSFSKTEYLPLE